MSPKFHFCTMHRHFGDNVWLKNNTPQNGVLGSALDHPKEKQPTGHPVSGRLQDWLVLSPNG